MPVHAEDHAVHAEDHAVTTLSQTIMMKLLTLAAFGAAAAMTGTHPQGSCQRAGRRGDPSHRCVGPDLAHLRRVPHAPAGRRDDRQEDRGYGRRHLLANGQWRPADDPQLQLRRHHVGCPGAEEATGAVALVVPPAPPGRSPHNRWGAAAFEQRDRSLCVFSCTTAAAQFSGG